MLIKIDFRETKLFKLCSALLELNNYKDIKLASVNLPLGDIIICKDNENNENNEETPEEELVIIERKSLNDLASSIRDGRYNEQSYRLNQCNMHNHQIYYLVEGDIRYYRAFKGQPDKKALLSSMISINYFKGFSLYRTNNLDETAEWILHFAYKLQKEKQSMLPYYNGGSEQKETNTYTEAINTKRIKKENITTANIGEIMLMQIPNVSSLSAIAVMNKFNTIAVLIDSLRNDVNCLNDIMIQNKNGQSKKLTKPTINNIYTYLVNQTSSVITVDV